MPRLHNSRYPKYRKHDPFSSAPSHEPTVTASRLILMARRIPKSTYRFDEPPGRTSRDLAQALGSTDLAQCDRLDRGPQLDSVSGYSGLGSIGSPIPFRQFDNDGQFRNAVGPNLDAAVSLCLNVQNSLVQV